MAAYSSVLGLIWRRSGYGGGLSNLVRGRTDGLLLGRSGVWVSRSFSTVESVSTGRMLPWLMLRPDNENYRNTANYQFLSVAEDRYLSFDWGRGDCSDFDPNDRYDTFVGSSQGWLCMINYGGYMGLINPLTRRHIKLPTRVTPSSSVPCLAASKIILSCSPDDPDRGGDECRALISYGPQDIIACCCPGRSSNWTRIGRAKHYKSVVYSKRQKLFFCARRGAYLEAWDLRDPLSPKLVPMDTSLLSLGRGRRPRSYEGFLSHTEYFLVINDDTDDLFLVRRFMSVRNKKYRQTGYTYDTECFLAITFDVHRYDPEGGSFRFIDPRGGGSSLDGHSFFISTGGNGFAVSAEEFPELKPDSIYFTKDVVKPPAWDDASDYKVKRPPPPPLDDAWYCKGDYWGIFNYQDATITLGKETLGEPWWFTPNTTAAS